MSTEEARGIRAASVVDRFAALPAGDSCLVRSDLIGKIKIAGRLVPVGVLFSGLLEAVSAIVRAEDPELSIELESAWFRIQRREGADNAS